MPADNKGNSKGKPSAVESAFKSLKDFVSGKTGEKNEKERLKPPSQITGVRG